MSANKHAGNEQPQDDDRQAEARQGSPAELFDIGRPLGASLAQAQGKTKGDRGGRRDRCLSRCVRRVREGEEGETSYELGVSPSALELASAFRYASRREMREWFNRATTRGVVVSR